MKTSCFRQKLRRSCIMNMRLKCLLSITTATWFPRWLLMTISLSHWQKSGWVETTINGVPCVPTVWTNVIVPVKTPRTGKNLKNGRKQFLIPSATHYTIGLIWNWKPHLESIKYWIRKLPARFLMNVMKSLPNRNTPHEAWCVVIMWKPFVQPMIR